MRGPRRTPARARTAAAVGSAIVVGWLALAACSNQGEGERCQSQNNHDDCQDDLVCLPAGQVNKPYDTSDRCCPVERSQATHPACTLLTTPTPGDSAPPPDTGPSPDAFVPDTGADTGADGGSTGPGDADAGDALPGVGDAADG